MTISVYEFGQFQAGSGQPMHPPDKATLASALPASVPLASTTRAVQILANADVRITTDGTTPGQTDLFLANKSSMTLLVTHPRTTTIKAVTSV